MIPKVEWSGVLFYTIEGSIRDLSTFKMEALDIFPMDKGTQGYTEYEFDDRVASYIMDNPQLFMAKIGHIHSHNTMNVFFSGTDADEIAENSEFHNFYLSLIVNNWLDLLAKVVYRVKGMYQPTPIEFTAVDEDGENYIIDDVGIEKKPEEITLLYIHDCEIHTPHNPLTVTEEFAANVKFIIDKPVKTKHGSQFSDWGSGYKGNNGSAKVGKTAPPGHFGNNYGGSYDTKRFAKRFEDKGKGKLKALPPHNFEEFKGIGVNEAFLCYCLRGGEVWKNDNIETVLESIQIAGIKPNDLAQSVLADFSDNYDKFFHDDKNVEMDDFLECIEMCADNLDDYVGKYGFVKELKEALQAFGFNIENAMKEHS